MASPLMNSNVSEIEFRIKSRKRDVRAQRPEEAKC